MDTYADVIVNIASLDKSFQYRVPQDLAGEIEAGTAVRIPFGNGGRMREGYVIGLSHEPKVEQERIKEISELAAGKVSVESRLIRLAAWMRRTYGSTMQTALSAVLPVRRRVRARKRNQSPLEEDLPGKDLPDGILSGNNTADEYSLNNSDGKGFAETDLSAEQKKALETIRDEWEGEDRPVLLQGVTGSGKTQIYMELTEQMLAEGKQAIILIPEIALSWQTVRRFRRRFGSLVSVMNSRMSQGERYEQFERMRRGEASVVIGPRSALFAPFASIGLIVIDEEQEPSFRSETMPRYDSREVALFRGKEEGAHVLFGSATPSTDSYYRARTGEYALVRLAGRYGDAQLPDVRIVDMRQEQKEGNFTLISRPLEEAVRKCLEDGEQAMLFLNRRGFSSVHTCQSCGFVLKCRHCNVSMTLHTNGRLVCHYCGYQMALPEKCPSCGSPHIQGFRYGTEKVERDVHALFPQAKILRMDADTTRHKNDYTQILGQFARHEADILIGTQMIVKGHDFPDVTMVGVLAADLSLFANDYRSEERTYQLLVQAVGRSGRGEKKGGAIIQTMHPGHDVILQAVEQDYEGFYEEEITARELAGYPPAGQLLAIHGTSEDGGQLEKAMQALRTFLLREKREEDLIGPAPESVGKKKDAWLEVLYVHGVTVEELVRLRMLAEKYIAINSGFHKIRFGYELNP